MGKAIEILIYLFILSIITEKIVSLVRRYPRAFQIIILLLAAYLSIVSFFSFKFSPRNGFLYLVLLVVFLFVLTIHVTFLLKYLGVNISFKFYNIINVFNPFKNIKKGMIGVNKCTKDNEITLLSFTIGFLVAISFNSNFFVFFNSNLSNISAIDLNQFFKEWYLFNSSNEFDFSTLLGIIATGFFLSFGSKFFYELLELLFQIRSLRDIQSNLGTYQVANVEELQKVLDLRHEDIVQSVYEREKDSVFKIAGVNGFSISNIVWNNKNMRGFKILTANTALIHDELFQYKMPGGDNYQVPFKIIKASITEACSQIYPSAKISNKGMTNFGTLCIPVVDNEKNVYFLSCYHVVKHTDHSWERFRTNGNEDVLSIDGTVLGRISDVRFNDTLDAALIEKATEIKVTDINTIIGDVNINSKREISGNDINSLVIKIQGATTSDKKEGYIVGHNSKQRIKYEGLAELKEISGLIELTDKSFENPLVAKGDSGALVYDSKGEAIAMIIATDNIQSYAIPIDAILKEFNVNIYK